jgi:hypothetical protein
MPKFYPRLFDRLIFDEIPLQINLFRVTGYPLEIKGIITGYGDTMRAIGFRLSISLFWTKLS